MKMPVLDKNFYPMIKALRDFDETVKNSGNAVKVTLTDREDDELFNMPMTVKVSVPKEWATASCNGAELEIKYDYNNKPYVYVDVTPTGDSALITGAPAAA